MTLFRWISLLLLTVCLAHPSNAEPVEHSDPQSITRIDWIVHSLEEEKTHASLWYYGFTGLYATSTVASFTIASTSHDPIVRATQRVSGWQSLIATGGMLLGPVPSAWAADDIRSMPAGTEAEIKSKLDAAESALRTSAETQSFNRSWINHALGVAVAGGGAAVIRYTYGHKIDKAGGGGRSVREATVNFWSSFIVGELQIWTMPVLSMDRWDEYSKNSSSGSLSIESVRLVLVPANDGLRAGIAIRF